jgi:hypothetical protein
VPASTKDRAVTSNSHRHPDEAKRSRSPGKPVPTLLLALTGVAAFAVPASAQNFFAGTFSVMPHRLILGSAPSPTPEDLCVYGSTELHCYTDATKKERRRFIPDPIYRGHFRELRPGDDKLIEDQIRAQKQVGREIFGLQSQQNPF